MQMTNAFLMRLDEIQPSQLYISSAKLSAVVKEIDASDYKATVPIPVKKLGDDAVLVDGHTRAYAAFLRGLSEIPVYWEDEELDWDAYEICVRWCREAGIHTIADLRGRVVSQEDYEKLWYGRCEEMQRGLARSKESKQSVERGRGPAKGGWGAVERDDCG